LVQGFLVQMAPLRLVNWGRIRREATGCQLLQDGLIRTRYAARFVNVFNAHQPLTSMGFGVQPACKRGN